MIAPFCVMIAGPNGSGKSTLTEELRRRGVDLGEYINADEIAATLEGAYPARVAAAQVEAERLRSLCIQEGRSFSFETVMSHPSKIDLLLRARLAGFRTGLYFIVTSSADMNVARVRQRVALGGHPVPEDRIAARYMRSLTLLPDATRVVDQVVLFDN